MYVRYRMTRNDACPFSPAVREILAYTRQYFAASGEEKEIALQHLKEVAIRLGVIVVREDEIAELIDNKWRKGIRVYELQVAVLGTGPTDDDLELYNRVFRASGRRQVVDDGRLFVE